MIQDAGVERDGRGRDAQVVLDPDAPDHGLPGNFEKLFVSGFTEAEARQFVAESLGYTVVDAATVVATHLSHVVRERSTELLGHDELRELIDADALLSGRDHLVTERARELCSAVSAAPPPTTSTFRPRGFGVPSRTLFR